MLAECKAREASINLHLQLGHYPVAPQATEHPRQPGPSRLRRRARRAQARAAAAANAAFALVRCDVAVQAVIPLPLTAETAVQTLGNGNPPSSDAAVQVCKLGQVFMRLLCKLPIFNLNMLAARDRPILSNRF